MKLNSFCSFLAILGSCAFLFSNNECRNVLISFLSTSRNFLLKCACVAFKLCFMAKMKSMQRVLVNADFFARKEKKKRPETRNLVI